MNKLVPVRRYGRLHRKTEASTQQLAHNLKLRSTLTVRVLSYTRVAFTQHKPKLNCGFNANDYSSSAYLRTPGNCSALLFEAWIGPFPVTVERSPH
jgi:hypothetical protein